MKSLDELRVELGNELEKVNKHYFAMVASKARAADIADQISACIEEELKKPRIPINDCEFGG